MEKYLLAPKKGKKEQKWAELLDKINFFVYCSKLAHDIFLIFCIKSVGIKGYKLPQMPFFRKILIFPQKKGKRV